MDGRNNREGCEEGEEICDICQQLVGNESRDDDDDNGGGGDDGDGSGLGEDREEYDMRQRELQVEDARHQAITLAAEEHQQFQDYRRKLVQQALQGCIFCSTANRDGDRAHSGLRCQEAPAIGGMVTEAYQLAVSMERFLRQRRVAEDFACCLNCFVPQELCNGWEENGSEGGWKRVATKQCQYEGIMISAIAWVWTWFYDDSFTLYSKLGFSELEEWTEKERIEYIWRWMGKKVIWGGVETLQMCIVFNSMLDL
jgi:hypothetical protein